MDKILDRILKFFQNKSISFSLKTSIFIISFFVLFSSDYFFNFTYDYHLNSKIEKLESINNLKIIYKSDSVKIRELTQLENRIYNRTHYSDLLRNLNLDKIISFKKTETAKTEKPVVKNENTNVKKPIRALFWMVVTSNYFFIILIIGLTLMLFTDPIHRELKNVLGTIAAIIILIGVIYLITWSAYKIPLIWNRPYLNYFLNIIIHSPTIYLIIWWNKTDKK